MKPSFAIVIEPRKVKYTKPEPAAVKSLIATANTDTHILHAGFYGLIKEINLSLLNESFGSFQLELVEGYRSPIQDHKINLELQKPWFNLHNYGFAADFKIHPYKLEISDICNLYGCEVIETPNPQITHIQLGGIDVDDLLHGKLPGGGGVEWFDNLLQNQKSWKDYARLNRLHDLKSPNF